MAHRGTSTHVSQLYELIINQVVEELTPRLRDEGIDTSVLSSIGQVSLPPPPCSCWFFPCSLAGCVRALRSCHASAWHCTLKLICLWSLPPFFFPFTALAPLGSTHLAVPLNCTPSSPLSSVCTLELG